MEVWNQLNLSQKDLERIFSKIDYPGNEEDCWEWNGNKHKQGYGRIYVGKYYLAHRLIYECYNGSIEDMTLVCHKCDNTSCVNPNHLFLGTHQDNTDDMISKGRKNQIVPLGSEHYKSILDEDQIKNILYSIENNNFESISEVSKKFDIDYNILVSILHGRSWKHITNDFDLCKLRDKTAIKKFTPNKYSNEIIEKIRNEFKNGKTRAQLSRDFSISYNTITHMVGGG